MITLGRDAHANLIESTEGILAAIDMLYSDNNEQFKAVMTREYVSEPLATLRISYSNAGRRYAPRLTRTQLINCIY